MIDQLNYIPTQNVGQLVYGSIKSGRQHYIVLHNDGKRFSPISYHFQGPDMAKIATYFCRERNFAMPTAKGSVIEIRQLFWRQQLALDGFHAPEFDRKRICIGFQPVPAIP